ncbi:MAG: hypothetical protein JJE30_06560 [Desulfuromonadales bacterium]|nr:hypothetical protein [Desulfuromonadales bacterium]
MQDNKLELLLSRFSTAARAHNEALEDMDEVRANAQARMIAGLYDAILSEGAAGRDGLLTLLDSDSPVVAGMAAVYSLNDHPEICLAALRRVAQEPGLLGFRASVAIERWEDGTWEHPGK